MNQRHAAFAHDGHTLTSAGRMPPWAGQAKILLTHVFADT